MTEDEIKARVMKILDQVADESAAWAEARIYELLAMEFVSVAKIEKAAATTCCVTSWGCSYSSGSCR